MNRLRRHPVWVFFFLVVWETLNLINCQKPISRLPTNEYSRLISSGFSIWIAQGKWLSIEPDPPSQSLKSPIQRIESVISYAPDNLFYRVNAAGILAYDFTANCTDSRRIKEWINSALKILNEGLQISPEDRSVYWYEIGKIELLKNHNSLLARKYFESAAKGTWTDQLPSNQSPTN